MVSFLAVQPGFALLPGKTMSSRDAPCNGASPRGVAPSKGLCNQSARFTYTFAGLTILYDALDVQVCDDGEGLVRTCKLGNDLVSTLTDGVRRYQPHDVVVRVGDDQVAPRVPERSATSWPASC